MRYRILHLFFSDTISEGYKNRIEAIIDEILATENLDYNVPRILFDGLDEEKSTQIHRLFNYTTFELNVEKKEVLAESEATDDEEDDEEFK
uniref:Uncharacterized protein n=1 Tax=Panagrolaimus davidi TaxID=227884 RepID=A0A914PVP1_9BILA